MKITALRPGRNPGRYSLFIDGRYRCTVAAELVVRLGLQPGLELNAPALVRLLTENQRQQALAVALRLLTFRGRSRQEITERLSRRGFSPEVAQATIARLIELELLDDARFAEALARERLELQRKGKRQIYADLRRKGIARPLIDQALAQAGDEKTAASALVAKYEPRYRALDPRVRYRRLHALLERRGFSSEVTRQVLAGLEREAAAQADAGE